MKWLAVGVKQVVMAMTLRRMDHHVNVDGDGDVGGHAIAIGIVWPQSSVETLVPMAGIARLDLQYSKPALTEYI